ncbi:2-polyprenyl-3-methyl-5-hydroxy-6-metoxy-1,4-benzoquinol methylase [Chryseobacterium defluvii]|uniref:2-polyprenyl-3-methyl-5-hydroxy-6-metoxy-1, 4-benzoquinol methylase n=1 Tax=Chryseobacterium defluvii TaxID=160396 RepID=A0A840K7C8_9FLAO|nr:class I SAM-dependent methyltransferase [Chryseobacterium defluvii]MBB4805116.1 2-polyprenyl-3-methyl-5-hydroxy-6-metoxy-1,4-benzoquinol methylase [Chryseobacterium defluvii]
MEHTGERHILNGNFNNKSAFYIHLMHMATYEYAKEFVKGKKVLDFGCGSGYGTQMLSENAESIVGADVSREAIEFAKKNYTSPNLGFKTIPELGGEKFDVITSFQVIEHVPNDTQYLNDLKKLLNPGGCLLISTPDKKNRLFNYIQKPWNIFHIKEYTFEGLESLLKRHFKKAEVLRIGSDSDLVLEEISRTRKQKMITLPFTLSIYPYPLRVFLLNTLKYAFELKNKIRPGKKNTPVTNNTTPDFVSQYSSGDIVIRKEIEHSTDLFAICIQE